MPILVPEKGPPEVLRRGRRESLRDGFWSGVTDILHKKTHSGHHLRTQFPMLGIVFNPNHGARKLMDHPHRGGERPYLTLMGGHVQL